MIPSLRTVCITSDFLHSFHLELGSSVGSRSCCRCLSSDRRISRSTPQRTDVPVVPELASLVAFAERSILSMFFTCYLLVLFVFQFFFSLFCVYSESTMHSAGHRVADGIASREQPWREHCPFAIPQERRE